MGHPKKLHPHHEEPGRFIWQLLNRQREFTVVACVFFLITLVGIPLFLAGTTRAALFCSGMGLFVGVAALWARQLQSVSGFQRRLERLRRCSPESQYVVSISNTHIRISNPDGSECQVGWRDLQSVRIFTTSWGPWLTDFWYALEGPDATCIVPLGATNLEGLTAQLHQLPNWNVEKAIEALGSTSEKQFVCWTASHA